MAKTVPTYMVHKDPLLNFLLVSKTAIYFDLSGPCNLRESESIGLCRDGLHRVASRRSESSQCNTYCKTSHNTFAKSNALFRVYITAFHQSSFFGEISFWFSPGCCQTHHIHRKPVEYFVMLKKSVDLCFYIHFSENQRLEKSTWIVSFRWFAFPPINISVSSWLTTNTEHNQKPSRIHGSKMCLVFQQLWQGLGLRRALAILARGLRVGHFVFKYPSRTGKKKGTKNQSSSCTVIYKLIEIMRHI